jgi:hypothetical protein
MEEFKASNNGFLVPKGDGESNPKVIEIERGSGDSGPAVIEAGLHTSTTILVLMVQYRGQINVLSLKISERFARLDQQTKSIVTILLGNQNESSQGVSGEMRDQTRAVTQLLSRLSEDTNGRDLEASQGGSLLSPLRDCSSQPERYTRRINMLGVTQEEERSLRNAVERSVLASLTFEGMTRRLEEVSDAHEVTFDWVFQDNSQRFFCANFADWLESGSGIYWVNGKAGSGKSTLMKFIWEHSETIARLNNWANETPLVVTNFFFWNSGSTEQKSQKGVLQSILHDIFTQCPDLITVLLPSVWAKYYSHHLYDLSGTTLSKFWTGRKLLKVFKEIVIQIQDRIRLCLFIDGLDEYEGDHEELGRLFKEISSYSHVKFCLSSRPWVVFQDLFKDLPSLRLQDITAGDIKRFVEAKLRSRHEFEILAARDPRPASNLIDAIVQRADGVFLWVELVVRSLMQGLRNRDTLPDLQRRLLVFPKELGPLYEHLLDMIEPFYKDWASRAFQIMRASQNQRNCVISTTEYSPPLTTLALYFAINEDADAEQIVGEDGKFERILEKCRDTQTQVTARCAGLLEIKEDTQGRCHQYTLTGLPSQTIKWLHRTARDYIENPSRWSAMVKLTSDPNFVNFSPNTSMLRSCIQILTIERMESSPWLKTSPAKDDLIENCTFISTSALLYAHNAEQERRYSYVSIIDQLSKILSTPFKGGHDPYRQYSLDWNDHVNNCHIIHHIEGVHAQRISRDTDGRYWRIDIKNLLPLAVAFGLGAYVKWKLGSVPSQTSLSVFNASLLYFVPTPDSGSQQLPVYPSPCREIVELLFKHGADPNANYYSSPSAWERALEWSHRIEGQEMALFVQNSRVLKEYWELLAVMIRYGANVSLQLACALCPGETIEHGMLYKPVYIFEMIQEGWPHFYGGDAPTEPQEGIDYLIRELRRRMVRNESRIRSDVRKRSNWGLTSDKFL